MVSFGRTLTLILVALILTLALLIPSTTNAQITSSYGTTTGINPVAFTLTIFDPSQQATYTNTMNLRFDLTWNASLETLFANHPVVEGYLYIIDNNSFVNVTPNGTLPTGQSYWFSYTIDISNLTNGYHKIAIRAYQYIYGPPPLDLFAQTSSAVTFLVQNPTPSPSPTPTPSPSPTPTPSPSPTPTPTMITVNEQILIIALIAVVVALSIVLLNYKRQRKTVNLKQ